MDRRLFLQGTATTLATATVLPATTEAASFPATPLSILQGLTTETTTQLTVDVSTSAKVAYRLLDVATGKAITPDVVKPVTFKGSSTRVDKLKFSGLELGHEYRFEVKDTKAGKKLDERFLSPVNLQKTGARIALMSCMHDAMSAKSKIWPSAEAANLDYMFFIGDVVYGDLLWLHGPSRLWSRYVETRKNLAVYHWKKLKPVIGVWDDHDFGKNDEDGDYKHKDWAYFMFKTFFAQDPEGEVLKNGWANSCLFQAFGQNFVFFDNRYYRSLSNPDGSKSFLGHDQIDWMTQAVTKFGKPTWVMQGSPFYGRKEKGCSYQATAPDEMDHFIGKIRSWGVPMIFAAGDLHFTEISKIPKEVVGHETYELVSSCMHSTTKSKFYDNPNPRVNGYLKENFLVLEQNGAFGEPIWKVSCIGKSLTLPFEMTIKV